MDDKHRMVLTWWKDQGGYWAVEYPELPGCMSDGATPEEAIANGRDAKQLWLEVAHEEGIQVPQPITGSLWEKPYQLGVTTSSGTEGTYDVAIPAPHSAIETGHVNVY